MCTMTEISCVPSFIEIRAKICGNQREMCQNGQICARSAYFCSDLNETWYTWSLGHGAHMLLMKNFNSSNFYLTIFVAHCDIWKKIISHERYETTQIFFRHNQDNGLKNVWCENFQNLTVGKLAVIFWKFFVFSIFFKNFKIWNFSFVIQNYFIFVLSFCFNHFFL